MRAGRRQKPLVTEENPLFRIGGGESGNRSDAERPTRRAVETDILPLFRALTAPDLREDADVVASCLIGMAKTARDDADVARLLEATTRIMVAPLQKETSFIALGLLRRANPGDAFPARTLDRVRERLFSAVDDESLHLRARCFAALAIGILGDQPTGDDEFSASARQTVRSLWLRLQEPSASEDLPVALLVALSLQPPKGVPDSVRDDLRALCATGRLGRQTRGRWTRAHAALALARLGATEHTGVLLSILRSRAYDVQLRRACAAGLAVLAEKMAPEVRAQAATVCLEVSHSGDADTSGLALMSAARLLLADFAEGSSLVEEKAAVGTNLVRTAETGSFDLRPFGALALATAAHDPGAGIEVPAFAALKRRAGEILRARAFDGSSEPSTRAAFCLALGIFGDDGSVGGLCRLAGARNEPEEIRAYAATALGLLGRLTPEVRRALGDGLADRASEVVRRAAARALGLLGDRTAEPLLIAQIRFGGADYLLARAALALADLGDVEAVKPLADLARGKSASDASRAIACAALGCLGDAEPVPSISRLGADTNWLVLTDALTEAISLL